MALHSSTLAWKIPWTEEPGRLQSMGSLRVGHNWATEWLHFSLSCVGEGNSNPLQCSCLENPRDGAAWWAAVYGAAQSWTGLKWLSSSSQTSKVSFNRYPRHLLTHYAKISSPFFHVQVNQLWCVSISVCSINLNLLVFAFFFFFDGFIPWIKKKQYL